MQRLRVISIDEPRNRYLEVVQCCDSLQQCSHLKKAWNLQLCPP